MSRILRTTSGVEVEHRAEHRVRADVVDQVVDPAERLAASSRRPRPGAPASCALPATAMRLVRAELRHGLGQRLGVAAGDADPVAAVDQRLGDGQADAAAGSGDDGGPAASVMEHSCRSGRYGTRVICTPGAMYARAAREARRWRRMGAYGLTIPLSGVPLHAQRELIASPARPRLHRRVVGRGRRRRRVHPAGAGRAPGRRRCAWAPRSCRRSPAAPPTIAQSAAALADAAPGRFALGIGTSSDVIVRAVERHPVRQAVRAGARRGAVPARRADRRRRSPRRTRRSLWTVSGCCSCPRSQPKLLVAALRPGMLAPGRPGGRRRHHQLARRPTTCRTVDPVRARRAGRTRRSWPASSSARPTTPTPPGPWPRRPSPAT